MTQHDAHDAAAHATTIDPLESGIVAALVRLLWRAARHDALASLADLDELAHAIDILQPDAPRARIALAWRYLRVRAWRRALGELRDVERRAGLSALGTALAAVCLYALGEASWRSYARKAAAAGDDEEATDTALALLAAPPLAPVSMPISKPRGAAKGIAARAIGSHGERAVRIAARRRRAAQAD
ncbi:MULTISPECIES: HrpB1 family type III secretion system apparatus protein [unclassified Paraburkholderia]|uniref:HrpB1 family type III secretion system apparatus protein n=1 Tax=unclassified Paraburkholderia TaxID=2615204 RepID=UPI002AB0A508|nr:MULTISPECIES: HrpB1 family type III secretion system apparatus protein [unclassified Paraburkholderia]